MKGIGLRCFILIILLYGCSQNSSEIKLESNKSLTELETELSTFCFPLLLEIEELEAIINEKLPTEIGRQRITKHHIRVDIRRAGLIRLGTSKNHLLTYVPLKVEVYQGRIRKKLKTDFTIEACISSDLSFDENWKIRSHSTLKNINWLKRPKVKILGLEIDIKSIIESEIKENEARLTSKVDNAIRNRVAIKPRIEKVWAKLQKPHNIIKRTGEQLFLHLRPQNLHYVGHSIKEGYISVNLLTELFLNLSTSQQTQFENTSLPPLLSKDVECDGFHLDVLTTISLDSLSASVNNVLAESGNLEVEGYKISLNNTKVRSSNNKIVIDVDIKGAVNGTVRGLCNLTLDTTHQTVQFQLEKTEIISGDIEMEVAHLVFGDFLQDYLYTQNGFQLGRSLEQLPILIENGLNRHQRNKKWHPEIKEMNTKITAFDITTDELILKGSCEGRMDIFIDNLLKK